MVRAIWVCDSFRPTSRAATACEKCGKRKDLHGTDQTYVVTTTVPEPPRKS